MAETDPKDIYVAVLQASHTLYRAAKGIPLEAYDKALQMIADSETLAPMIDPTLYRKAAQALGEDKEIIEAVRALAALGPREEEPDAEQRAA